MSSQTSTPYLAPSSSQTLPPPSPAPLVATTPKEAPSRSRRSSNTKKAAVAAAATTAAATPLDGIPPLSLSPLTDRADKVDALRLIADSVAQQRQLAAFHLVFHPFPLAGLIAALGFVYQYTWAANKRHDLGAAIALASGVLMTYLLTIRYLTSGYLKQAETINWEWLRADPDEDAVISSASSAGSSSRGAGPTDEDILIGARFGDEMIGALALRLEQPSAGRRKARTLKGGKGVVRAWTTKLRFRGKGVGGDLLKEAVRLTREKCGKDAEVGFALEHANAHMVLPEVFNSPFRKRERRAAKALEGILAEGKRKR